MFFPLKSIYVLAAFLALSVAASQTHATGTSSGSGSPKQRMRNPFVGATWYVNPKWRDNVLKEPDGSLIANYSTAVWFDHIGAIAPSDGKTWGLAAHLDHAITQKANLIEIVIYDLPNRDCNALASSGELLISQDGFNRYKNEYITPMVKILSDAKYKDLRIIAIIEPDSLPNLVTNTSVKKCQEAAGPGGYVDATRFTLDSFYPLSNVYSYVDIGHSGWLGWDDNLNKSAAFIAEAIKGTAHEMNSVAGFISNTANYTPLREPFLDEFSMSAMPGSKGSIQVRQARFYSWNARFSELAYVQDFHEKMISLGFPSTIGMLIDTSRNGWGGAKRPKALSAHTSVDAFVDQSKIDRRVNRGLWCNQPGGIGERPRAAPVPGVDAYVWVKPPGDSDGVAMAGIIDPDDPAKSFDPICDPTFVAPGSDGQPTGALPGAPHAGRWFSTGFKTLIENAYPPLK